MKEIGLTLIIVASILFTGLQASNYDIKERQSIRRMMDNQAKIQWYPSKQFQSKYYFCSFTNGRDTITSYVSDIDAAKKKVGVNYRMLKSDTLCLYDIEERIKRSLK